MLRLFLFCIFLTQVISFPGNPTHGNNNGVVVMKQSGPSLFVNKENERGNVKNERGMIGECFICSEVVSLVKGWLKKGSSHNEIAESLQSKCKFIPFFVNKEVCKGSIEMFKDVVLEVLGRTTLGSYEICDVITKQNCSQHYVAQLDWSVDIPDMVVVADDLSVEKSFDEQPEAMMTSTKSDPLKVLHLTDVHIDFEYKPGSKAKCSSPLCCRSGTPFWKSDRADYWATAADCDIPKWTIEDLFQKLSKEKFDYILWTGDLASHNVWNQSKEDEIQTLEFLVNLFVKYFPDTPVYPALGNHEGIPVNNFPQHSISTNNTVDWLYQQLARSWGKWLPDDVQPTITRGGFYSALVAPKFRIVSLNMNFCNNFNWWLLIDSKDPELELNWLVSVLQKAEENGEKVQIIGHIPPGIPDCLKTWSSNYYRIVNRYKRVIAAQFFGHIHYDSFHLFYDTGYESHDSKSQPIGEPIAIAYVSPSVTTYKKLNPGYRVFEVDGFRDDSTWSVLNHYTYIMDVAMTKKLNATSWLHEYSAKEAYGLESLSPKNWEKLVFEMKSNTKLFNEYYNFYHKSYPAGSCNSSCRKMMLCSLVSGRSYDASFCDKLYHKKHNDNKLYNNKHNNDKHNNKHNDNKLYNNKHNNDRLEVGESSNQEEPLDYSDFVRWHNEHKLC